jgi:hypothetical protein
MMRTSRVGGVSFDITHAFIPKAWLMPGSGAELDHEGIRTRVRIEKDGRRSSYELWDGTTNIDGPRADIVRLNLERRLSRVTGLSSHSTVVTSVIEEIIERARSGARRHARTKAVVAKKDAIRRKNKRDQLFATMTEQMVLSYPTLKRQDWMRMIEVASERIRENSVREVLES